MSAFSRRGLLKGLAAASIVVGFDPTSRSWLTEARAEDFQGLPPLDGVLTTDAATRAAFADDYGHIVHRTPIAVLFPESVGDIVKIIKFARVHGLAVGPRGRGHSPFGQSQLDAGVLIDMSTLAEIHSITSTYADVDAGASWRDLLLATIPLGLTPPVLTDYTNLSVGGTLSVGGVSGRSYRHGAQVDNVLEVDVVTGEGKVITCSSTQNQKLFSAVLGGLGLSAIIVRAKIRLIPAKAQARTHRCLYASIPTLLADMRFLVQQGRFDSFHGAAQPSPEGWVYYLECTSFYTPGDESAAGDPAALPLPVSPFAGLAHIPGTEQVEEKSYFEYCDSVVQLIALLDALGLGGLPHPWLDLFMPASRTPAFATQAVASVDPASLMPGSTVLIFPFLKSRMKSPLLRVPDEAVFFLFDMLFTTPPDPSVVAAALQRNRALYDQACALGGTQYTISAIPNMTKHDWKKHFQPEWGLLNSTKKQHDPGNVLGTSINVF